MGQDMDKRKRDESINFPDRRIADCPNHEGLSERIAGTEKECAINSTKVDAVESQVADLYDKYNDTTSQFSMIISRLTGIETNQKSYMEDFKKFVKGFELINIDGRLKALEDFSWFRKPATMIRDNLFWFIITLIGCAVLILTFSHNDTIELLIKKFLM